MQLPVEPQSRQRLEGASDEQSSQTTEIAHAQQTMSSPNENTKVGAP
jgi:hypothetical protein